jgi:hypothetical protein
MVVCRLHTVHCASLEPPCPRLLELAATLIRGQLCLVLYQFVVFVYGCLEMGVEEACVGSTCVFMHFASKAVHCK